MTGWGLDVDDKENEIVVRADAPGFEPDDFNVEIVGDNLVLKGERGGRSLADEEVVAVGRRQVVVVLRVERRVGRRGDSRARRARRRRTRRRAGRVAEGDRQERAVGAARAAHARRLSQGDQILLVVGVTDRDDVGEVIRVAVAGHEARAAHVGDGRDPRSERRHVGEAGAVDALSHHDAGVSPDDRVLTVGRDDDRVRRASAGGQRDLRLRG